MLAPNNRCLSLKERRGRYRGSQHSSFGIVRLCQKWQHLGQHSQHCSRLKGFNGNNQLDGLNKSKITELGKHSKRSNPRTTANYSQPGYSHADSIGTGSSSRTDYCCCCYCSYLIIITSNSRCLI